VLSPHTLQTQKFLFIPTFRGLILGLWRKKPAAVVCVLSYASRLSFVASMAYASCTRCDISRQ
jgi:hypothetical protein